MSALFGRQWSLSVGSLDLSDLDLSFKVARTTRREPNSAEIQVFNLSRQTRARVEQGGLIRLYAGYEDPAQIFQGDSRYVYTTRDGTEQITTLIARDGGHGYVDSPISRAYAPGTPVETVIRDALDVMGIGRGNLADFVYGLDGGQDLADGYVAHGPANRVLNDLIRASGCRWSVQHGALQVQRRGQALQTRVVVLSPDSGLLGSPTWDERGLRSGGRRGVLTCVTLIQPGIEPGRMVRIDTVDVTGDFEVRGIEYVGDTRADDWTASLTLRRPRA